MDTSYSREEIISLLQHLPYHSHQAYALRVALTLLEEPKKLSSPQHPNTDTNNK